MIVIGYEWNQFIIDVTSRIASKLFEFELLDMLTTVIYYVNSR